MTLRKASQVSAKQRLIDFRSHKANFLDREASGWHHSGRARTEAILFGP
jgi:hypothetical protein